MGDAELIAKPVCFYLRILRCPKLVLFRLIQQCRKKNINEKQSLVGGAHPIYKHQPTKGKGAQCAPYQAMKTKLER
jgi:hypothetical protein